MFAANNETETAKTFLMFQRFCLKCLFQDNRMTRARVEAPFEMNG